ncbi:MAG: cation-transporting P-type ATPase [Ilumatobacteraceae bacterium]
MTAVVRADRDAGGPISWHASDTDEVLRRLDTSSSGLSDDDAGSRLEQYGTNELTERGGTSAAQLIFEQLRAVMVLILIAASLLSLALGKYLEAGAIAAIVVLFATLGFVQEYRAEQAIAALRKMATRASR